MILFTAKDFNNLHRGAALLGERWSKLFPKYIAYKEQSQIISWEKEAKQYDKIVLLTQVPNLYSISPNFYSFKKIPHIFTIREDHHPELFNSATNCFSIYKENDKYKFFFPRFLSPPKISNKKIPDTLGFYSRPNVTPDTIRNFIKFLDNLNQPIRLYILGENSIDFSHHKNILTTQHTYDNKTFFENITHYIYFHSNKKDPFPHSLLEAINLNKQIIIPNQATHKDGVFDLKESIKYHVEYNPEIILDNQDCIFTEDNFLGFYNYLISINFEYKFDRKLYKNFYDWTLHEVIPRKEYRLSS